MTLKLTHNIICDVCNNQIETPIISKKRMPRKARRFIIKRGWTISNVGSAVIDLCPECTIEHRGLISTKKFVEKYIGPNLFSGETKEVVVKNIVRKIDAHFISIEKHTVMIEGIEDK